EVGEDGGASGADVRSRIEIERVGFDDRQSIGITFRDLGERGDGARIALDRDHPARALRQQRARQAAGAGTDLDDGDAAEIAGGAGDACGEIEVENEVLSERFACRQAVTADDVAQRRQIVDSRHQLTGIGFVSARAASRSARRMAAIRLVGSALPVPAMSNAVPWSGEVRTIGRPSVTFTAWSNASVLIGISA